MSNFHGIWEGEGFRGVADSFQLSDQEREAVERDFEILHAAYTNEDYSGQAFVVLRSRADGSLWEVHGSHCSCAGLEGQWAPEESCIEALRARHQAQPLLGLETVGVSWLDALFEARDLEDAVPMATGTGRSRSRSGAL